MGAALPQLLLSSDCGPGTLGTHKWRSCQDFAFKCDRWKTKLSENLAEGTCNQNTGGVHPPCRLCCAQEQLTLLPVLDDSSALSWESRLS